MAELSLGSGTKQRSMLVPVLLALLVLAAAGAWFAKTYVHASVTGAVNRVTLYPVHVEYQKPSVGIVGAANQTEDELYVIADVTLNDRSELPLFLSSFEGSFTMDDGTVMEANVISRTDLPRLMLMFPKMKSAVDGNGSAPLLTEGTVPKGTSTHGYVVLSYNVPQGVWDKRKAADVTVKFYHQDPLTMALPK